MRGLSMATPRSYRPQLPKDGTLLRALRPDDRAAVAPAGESTRPPHALAASRLRVGTHRTCIARAPRARPAPRRLRSLASPPRAPCVSITTRRAGRRAVWHTQPPGDTHAGGAGLAREQDGASYKPNDYSKWRCSDCHHVHRSTGTKCPRGGVPPPVSIGEIALWQWTYWHDGSFLSLASACWRRRPICCFPPCQRCRRLAICR